MRKVFLLFFFLFLSITSVYADRYFKDQDIVENKYYDTLGYSIGELLESQNCPNCVEYDIDDVFGTNSSEVISQVNIDDITDPDSIYGLMRLHNLYDEVALPPFSSVDFIYWSKNMAGVDVNISAIKMFLSRHYSYQGDITKVLDIAGEYEILPIKYIVWEYPRNGLIKMYEGLGIVNNGGGVLNGMRLDSAIVKSPLRFIRWEAENLETAVLLRVYVRNGSDQVLKNVKYTHQQYSNIRDFDSQEEYFYEYEVIKDENGSLGYAGIFNPSEREECIARGEHLESNYVGDSAVVGGIREEDGGYLAYIGSRVKPFGHRFCVRVIPYTLYSEEIFLPVEQESVEDTNSNNQEDAKDVTVSEDMGEVLGVEKLPQTGINRKPFLVVFQILWYYLLRRNVL